MSRRLKLSRREIRILRVQRYQSGLGMIPWGWDREKGDEGEVPVECAHRVKCPHCKTTYAVRQMHYIEQHFVKKHGYTFAQALHGALGGDAERERLGMPDLARPKAG